MGIRTRREVNRGRRILIVASRRGRADLRRGKSRLRHSSIASRMRRIRCNRAGMVRGLRRVIMRVILRMRRGIPLRRLIRQRISRRMLLRISPRMHQRTRGTRRRISLHMHPRISRPQRRSTNPLRGRTMGLHRHTRLRVIRPRGRVDLSRRAVVSSGGLLAGITAANR